MQKVTFHELVLFSETSSKKRISYDCLLANHLERIKMDKKATNLVAYFIMYKFLFYERHIVMEDQIQTRRR